MSARRLILFTLVGLAPNLYAQGTIPGPDLMWTWQGDSAMFQGSFETPSNYLTPNIGIANGLYNLNIIGPDRTWTSDLNISGDPTQFNYYGPGAFGIQVFDPSGETLVATPDSMVIEVGNMSLGGELGSWEISPIPEPSSSAILALGGGTTMWLVTRRRAGLLGTRTK